MNVDICSHINSQEEVAFDAIAGHTAAGINIAIGEVDIGLAIIGRVR